MRTAAAHVVLLEMVALVVTGAMAAKPQPHEASRPNILFVLADDLGWGDPSCYGNARATGNVIRANTQRSQKMAERR